MIQYIKRSLTGAFLLSFLLIAVFRLFYCLVVDVGQVVCDEFFGLGVELWEVVVGVEGFVLFVV